MPDQTAGMSAIESELLSRILAKASGIGAPPEREAEMQRLIRGEAPPTTGETVMRAPTLRERIGDMGLRFYGALANSLPGSLMDAVGLTNFKGVVAEGADPNAKYRPHLGIMPGPPGPMGGGGGTADDIWKALEAASTGAPVSRRFAILTGANPGLKTTANAADFLNDVKRLGGNVVYPSRGVWESAAEPSHYVEGLSDEVLDALAQKYGQSSVINQGRMRWTTSGKEYAPTGVERLADDVADNMTEIQLPDGSRMKFRLNYPKETWGEQPERMLQLEHRTSAPLRPGDELDPLKVGTGQLGEERERIATEGFLPRTYYTIKGQRVEGRFQGLPMLEGEVPQRTIYDMERDPLQLIPMAQQAGKGDRMLTRNIFDKLVESSNFDGYTDGTTVVYFRKLRTRGGEAAPGAPVAPAAPATPGAPPAAKNVPLAEDFELTPEYRLGVNKGTRWERAREPNPAPGTFLADNLVPGAEPGTYDFKPEQVEKIARTIQRGKELGEHKWKMVNNPELRDAFAGDEEIHRLFLKIWASLSPNTNVRQNTKEALSILRSTLEEGSRPIGLPLMRELGVTSTGSKYEGLKAAMEGRPLPTRKARAMDNLVQNRGTSAEQVPIDLQAIYGGGSAQQSWEDEVPRMIQMIRQAESLPPGSPVTKDMVYDRLAQAYDRALKQAGGDFPTFWEGVKVTKGQKAREANPIDILRQAGLLQKGLMKDPQALKAALLRMGFTGSLVGSILAAIAASPEEGEL